MKLFTQLTAALSAIIALAGLASAQTASTTLDGLPNFSSADMPTARVNTLTVTLTPDAGLIHGLRGTTVGWGFSITLQSNAGDKIAFTGSRLVGDTSAFTNGYVDYIGKLSGKTNGITAAGETWERPFVENSGGLGAVPLLASAKPGSGYVGKLRLAFDVFDSRGPALGETLGSFEMLLDVAVLVDAEDPVEQTITFASIADPTYGSAPFTVSPTASSGLPVTLTSLNPEVCTVDGNTVTIVGAGTCTLLAEQDGDTQYNPAPRVTQSFTVAKGAASVSITGNLTPSFDGTPKPLSGTPTPGSLEVTLLYGGDPTPPSSPGLYAVKALINDPNYTGFATADLLIIDLTEPALSTYGDWLAAHFGPEFIGNPALVGATANPDSDAFQNSFEYAMGFDPLAPSSVDENNALPRLSVTPVDWTLSLSIPEQAGSDVTFIIETSPDLSPNSWQEISRRVGGGAWTGTATVFTGSPQNSRIPILISQPGLPISGRRFYRMRVIVQ